MIEDCSLSHLEFQFLIIISFEGQMMLVARKSNVITFKTNVENANNYIELQTNINKFINWLIKSSLSIFIE